MYGHFGDIYDHISKSDAFFRSFGFWRSNSKQSTQESMHVFIIKYNYLSFPHIRPMHLTTADALYLRASFTGYWLVRKVGASVRAVKRGVRFIQRLKLWAQTKY